MKLLHTITDFTNVDIFGRKDYCQKWIRDVQAATALNETLGTNFQAVFREEQFVGRRDWYIDDIDWDSEHFFVVTASGKVLQFTNSEWGGIGTPE